MSVDCWFFQVVHIFQYCKCCVCVGSIAFALSTVKELACANRNNSCCTIPLLL